MLQVQNVTKKYGKLLAVNQVSFELEPGSVTVLLGPNGAGKSTLMKAIIGFLRYDGAILVGGYPNKTVEAKRILGYIPEMPALYPNLTVSEHMEFLARDVAEFRERYPGVDLLDLEQDEAFLRFCGSRYGREPMAELFTDYLELTARQQTAAQARSDSRSRRATGAGSGSGGETLTVDQQKALDEWNRAFPQMRMTAKEFLSR